MLIKQISVNKKINIDEQSVAISYVLVENPKFMYLIDEFRANQLMIDP